jgi:diguanylate cyclase (GGDEF)-like protein
MNQDAEAKEPVLLRVVASTVIATLCSAGGTYVAIIFAFGSDPNIEVRLVDAVRFGLFVSTVLPLILAPGVAYSLARLVQQLRQAQRELLTLSLTDQLTGLFNRRGFDAAAAVSFEAAARAAHPIAVLMCDIDHFKGLNDSLGHGFGDQCLVHVADAFRAITRGTNFIAGRQGGDEFVMMLPGTSRAEAVTVGERLRAACAAPVGAGSGPVVSISVGIAVSRAAEMSLSLLMSAADAALYDGKRAGRNRVSVWDQGTPVKEYVTAG